MTAIAYAYVQSPLFTIGAHLAAFVLGVILAAAMNPRNDWRAREWAVAGPVGLACLGVVLWAVWRWGW